MRKVIFRIDDLAYFKKVYNLTEKQMNEFFTKPAFQAIYTLYGREKSVYRYELTDFNGNKILLNSLNGYIRGIILNDCMAYFYGYEYHDRETTEPFGVISIEESECEA